MPGHGLQARGIAREQKMIYAGMTLFLEQGYERTTTAQIARKAGMSPASFFAAFENKEALLLRLTQIMFRSQFSRAEKMLPADQSPLLLYAMETGLQLHIAECSEPLRDLYVTAYSLPSTSDFINRSMTPRLRQIFSRWMKRADDSELFELEKYPALALEVQCHAELYVRPVRYVLHDGAEDPPLSFVLLPPLLRAGKRIRPLCGARPADGSASGGGEHRRRNGPECRSGLRCDHGSSCRRKLSQKNPAGVADSGRISLYEGLIQNVATSFFAGSAGVTRMAVRMGPVPR